MESIKNKTAFVTGGSRGIGQEIVRKLFSEGVNVAFTYSNSENEANQVVLELSSEETKVIALKADSGNEKSIVDAINRAFETFGSLDILVNNAGVVINDLLPDVKMEDFDKMVAVNIKGVFVAIQTASAIMNDGGRIITIGSAAAERSIFPSGSVYAMTKAAVARLTRGVARDLAPRGITVNTVQPGPIETEMNPADSQFADIIRGYVALGHYGTKSDIAELVAFLANPSAKYITGASINIDGGLVS
ncbi:3-oxoacyl-ACP reductase FabG [Chryseobacterium aquaticum]|uniref:3-oxoacyl-ACP reductase FabG n=1 Tax=Chryseobacterium aquaticum TaxID=452084 RepID=A0A848N444_9FLAO|nr:MULTISPECIES: 3-oxoacyl-ACP reductase family protein [Chryseobacterium]NMR33179.1 3-oxoacyl-ACP reductase FabG [Chryseobacterium aquaticum]NRQ44889.1 3-oxoacyl-ACP reductase FabG [Chryseobacterium sp. C-204]